MKKLINEPTTVVTDALAGIAAAHPELRVDHERKVIYRATAPVSGKVGLISGGGSGHEPLHGGFVGLGMLDAACAGEVFTSPTPDQMYEATKLVDGGAGVLHIVKNYTGDVLNFEMAAEMAAEDAGVKVEAIVTNDDVAVEDSLYTAGRRGVGVTVLAREDLRRRRRGRAGSGRRGRHRPQGQRVGAQHGHGAHVVHRARRRQADLRARRDRDGDRHRHPRRAGPPPRAARHRGRDRRAAARPDRARPSRTNAATPCWRSSTAWAARRCSSSTSCSPRWPESSSGHGITIERSLVGPYITSLEMAGCSITLLKLDDELVRLWDAPVRTPALRWGA